MGGIARRPGLHEQLPRAAEPAPTAQNSSSLSTRARRPQRPRSRQRRRRSSVHAATVDPRQVAHVVGGVLDPPTLIRRRRRQDGGGGVGCIVVSSEQAPPSTTSAVNATATASHRHLGHRAMRPAMLNVMPIRILLDCDPGHDDVVAIVAAPGTPSWLASRRWPASAPSTARRTTLASCAPCSGFHARAAGAIRPLLAEPHPAAARARRERDRRCRPAGPASQVPTATTRSGFIVDTCSQEGLWLVPTGPLTNIALAMPAALDLLSRMAGVSLMGGGSFPATARRSPSSTSGLIRKRRRWCSHRECRS